MKRITILSVIMTILSFSFISAQNTSEKEITFQNGTIKGVFAKGRLQSGIATFDCTVSNNPYGFFGVSLHLEGIYQATTDTDYNFNGILSTNGGKFGCRAKIGQYVKSAFTGQIKEVKNGIKSNPKYHLHLYKHILDEYYPEKDNGIIQKVTLDKAFVPIGSSNGRGNVHAEEYSIFYKNGNILISKSSREDNLSFVYPGYRSIEYKWPNGDVFTGNTVFGSGKMSIKEQIDMLASDDHFRISMTDGARLAGWKLENISFKLKNGNIIDMSALTDIKDCEENKKIVFNSKELADLGKTPSEIVAIRDSVLLAQEAKKQRLEEEKRRLEEKKKRQEEERRQERIRKYGEEIALLIEKGEIAIGMTKEMVLESIQNKKKIYDITYDYNQEYWRANRNKVKKFLQYEVPKKSAEDVLAETLVGAMFQSLGLSEDYMKALFKYDYLEFRDNILVGFSEWQDREDISNSYYNAMSLFGL